MNTPDTNILPAYYAYFDNKFGNVVPFEEIQSDPSSYSSVFCEGSAALKELLCDVWSHGYETRGCCVGHEAQHYYVRDKLFGGQEYIDESTYLAHAGSRRYHDYTAPGHAYLAFVPKGAEPAQDICDRIERAMQKELPDLQYATNAFPDLITISLAQYERPAVRERFFRALSAVLHRELYHTHQPIKAIRKPTLDEQIKAATAKKEENLRNRSPLGMEPKKHEHASQEL